MGLRMAHQLSNQPLKEQSDAAKEQTQEQAHTEEGIQRLADANRATEGINLPGRAEDDQREADQGKSGFKSELIHDFLTRIQEETKAQICALYLVNDNGLIKRAGIVGRGKDGTKLKHEQLGKEEFEFGQDSETIFSLILQSAEQHGRYGQPLFVSSACEDRPDLIEKIRQLERKELYDSGEIGGAVFYPIQGANWSFGVLFICNKTSAVTHEVDIKAYTPSDFLSIAVLAERLTYALLKYQGIQEQKINLDIQQYLSNWAKYAREIENLSHVKGAAAKSIIKKVIEDYDAILGRIVGMGHVKSATLRLKRSLDNKYVCLASRTREESGTKNNAPRPPGQECKIISDADDKLGLVAKAVKRKKYVLIRDISEPIQLTQFLNQEWIRANNFRDYICIPMLANEKVVGTLSLFTARNRFLASNDIVYLHTLANSIAIFTALIFAARPVAELDSALIDKVLNYAEHRRSDLLPNHPPDPNAANHPKELDRSDDMNSSTKAAAQGIPGQAARTHREANQQAEEIKGAIFISFCQADQAIADEIKADLQSLSIDTPRKVALSNHETSIRPVINWDDFESIIVLLSDQCSSDAGLKANEWAPIYSLSTSKLETTIIPIRISGHYLPAFLSSHPILAGQTPADRRQALARLSDYPSAGAIQADKVRYPMNKRHQAAMKARYQALAAWLEEAS